MNMDKMMERVYRLTSTMGHKRAIVAVAGDCWDEQAQAFVPCTELQCELRERYDAEMAEFNEAGGY